MNSTKLFFHGVSALLFLLSGPGCAEATESLFDRLGGEQKITAAAYEIVSNVSRDPRTKRSFEGVALAPLKASVAAHLVSITGGPANYKGETMALAHTGLAITAAEFDVMGTYVDAAFTHQGASESDRKELEGLLEAMRPDVQGK